jgi:hypothetical protein
MRFTIIAASLLVTLVRGTPVADAEASVLKRTWYDCKGSSMCGNAVNFNRDCDRAVNSMLIRTDAINYGAAGSVFCSKHNISKTNPRYRSGLPDGAEKSHCKIFIAGPSSCKRSGNGMWQDYQEIRSHGCKHCGSKHWGSDDVCRTTVNYVG